MLSSVTIDGKNVLQLSPLANQGEGGKLPPDKNYTFTSFFLCCSEKGDHNFEKF